jgi:hypothetical protein
LYSKPAPIAPPRATPQSCGITRGQDDLAKPEQQADSKIPAADPAVLTTVAKHGFAKLSHALGG